VLPWAHPSPDLKPLLIRFNLFAQFSAERPYTSQWAALSPQNCPFSWEICCQALVIIAMSYRCGRRCHSFAPLLVIRLLARRCASAPCVSNDRAPNAVVLCAVIACNYYFARGSGCDVMSRPMCVCVCLSVCPRRYLRNHTRDLYKFFVHVACVRGSVLLRHGDRPGGAPHSGELNTRGGAAKY